MRLVLTSDNRIAVERDGGIVDVSAAFADIRFRTAADRMPRVLAVLKDRRTRVEELAASGQSQPMPALQAPVPRPPKIMAAFGNYREGSDRERQTQDMFLESPDSVMRVRILSTKSNLASRLSQNVIELSSSSLRRAGEPS